MNDTIKSVLVITAIIGIPAGGVYSCTVSRMEDDALRKQTECRGRPAERDTDKIRAALAKDPTFYERQCREEIEASDAANRARKAHLLSMERALVQDVHALCAKFHQLRLSSNDPPFLYGIAGFDGADTVARVANMCIPLGKL